MSAPLRPLLPRPDPDGNPGPSSRPTHRESKRRNTTNACDPCRKRKAKCDGRRPECSTCKQRQVACMYSVRRRITLTTEEEEAERTEQEKTREAGEIVRQLRTLPPDLALELLQSLRASATPAAFEGRAAYEDGPPPFAPPSLSPRLSELQVLRSLLPPTQNSLDFELVVRHPIAYPALFPLRAASLPLQDLLRPTRLRRRQKSTVDRHVDAPLQSAASEESTTPATGYSTPMEDSTGAAQPLPRPLVDNRLVDIQIRQWTNVPITDDLAARVISLYLEIDYPVLPLFNADLFIGDLVGLRPHFCSRLLVSALLCWACQAYTAFSPETASLSVAFFDEAESTLSAEERLNTLTTAAAIQFLSQTATMYGNDRLAVKLLKKGVEVGKSMGLFGVQSEVESAEIWLNGHEEWRRAASYTAWGVFNWVTLHSLQYHTAEIETPPLVPMPPPDTTPASPSVDNDGYAGIASRTQTFNACCRLWTILSDVVWTYYGDESATSVPLRVSLDFAEKTYQRLLGWADALPLNLVRGDQNTHAVMMMHIYFHAIITDLFRPLLAEPWRFLRLYSFTAAHATPEAAYTASAGQLKRLLLIYRLAFRTATLSALWQTPLIYVANAMVREATTSSAEWRFYMELCLAGLQDLYASFRVFGSVAEGLLSMALRRGVMDADDAGRIAGELLELGRHHAVASGVPSGEEPVAALWIIDFDLAMTDPEAAQAGSLAEEFQELILTEQLGADGMSGANPSTDVAGSLAEEVDR